MLLLTGSTSETYKGDLLEIVSWDTLKAHLKQNTEEDKSLIDTYLKAAVSYCEQYTQRNLVAKSVKMYYHAEPVVSATLQLRYCYDQSVSVIVKDSDSNNVDISNPVLIAPDRVFVDNLPSGWQLITVTYEPALYEDIEGIVPAILMKVGEMYYNREDGPIPKISSIISILNRHRIKRHF